VATFIPGYKGKQADVKGDVMKAHIGADVARNMNELLVKYNLVLSTLTLKVNGVDYTFVARADKNQHVQVDKLGSNNVQTAFSAEDAKAVPYGYEKPLTEVIANFLAEAMSTENKQVLKQGFSV
jgi:hypothetical protein